MLTVKAAAARSGLSPSLIYALCAQRRLPHLRCGTKGRRGRVLIAESDLVAFMESCRVAAEDVVVVKTPAAGVRMFQNLDAGRLQEAWRKQGALKEG